MRNNSLYSFFLILDFNFFCYKFSLVVKNGKKGSFVASLIFFRALPFIIFNLNYILHERTTAYLCGYVFGNYILSLISFVCPLLSYFFFHFFRIFSHFINLVPKNIEIFSYRCCFILILLWFNLEFKYEKVSSQFLIYIRMILPYFNKWFR